MGAINGPLIVSLLTVVDRRGNRERAVEILKGMLPNIDLTHVNTANKLYQVLPALFAHFYLKNDKNTVVNLIDQIISIEPYVSRKKLLSKWRNFVCRDGSMTLTENTNNYCRRFARQIGYEDLEFFIHICRYLKNERKLHKYIYFFSNLSYVQFLDIQEDTIVEYADNIALLPITNGAQGAIVQMMEQLDHRVDILRVYAKGDYFLSISPDFEGKFETCSKDLAQIMRTPIRRSDLTQCAKEEEISFLLVASLRHISVAAKKSQNEGLIAKVGKLLENGIGMKYFNKAQIEQLKEIEWNLHHQSTSHNCEPISSNGLAVKMDSNSKPVRPQEVPEVFFEDEEIQAGWERTILFLEVLLRDE